MNLQLPDIGKGINPARLLNWYVKKGDEVKKGDILCEIEINKAIIELPAPENDVISNICCQEGEEIKAGDPLIS